MLGDVFATDKSGKVVAGSGGVFAVVVGKVFALYQTPFTSIPSLVNVL